MNKLKTKTKINDALFAKGSFHQQDFFHNRDLSWWDFNERVLNEALDERTPLLERLRFIDIFRSNSDEFFMKRYGPLLKKVMREDTMPTLDGLIPEVLFEKIEDKNRELNQKLFHYFEKKIAKQCEKEGIKLLRWADLSVKEKAKLTQEFKHNIFPILTPLAVDSGHPFPFLSNLSKSIGIILKKPYSKKKSFARVKIPSDLPQWLVLEGTKNHPMRFVYLDDVVAEHLHLLFPGMKIEGKMMFKVIRDAVIEEDDEADDIMDFVEEGLKERKFAPIVRFEHEAAVDPWILRFLMDELDLTPRHCSEVPSFLIHSNFSRVVAINRPDLKYPVTRPKLTPLLNFETQGLEIFETIKKADQMAHFPYQSYRSSVESFLSAAASDPKVRAIKIVLYRTDDDGHLISLLEKAAENKKQVACVIELKARFDEERNIKWANKLEESGIHVSYGLAGIKTHAKLILVVRQETKGLVSYGHIGTGNFNSKTAKLYTDLSLFTANKALCADIGQVFNYLTGNSLAPKISKLLVAPFNMKKVFLNLIEQEIKNALAGVPSGIVAKMNSLEDTEIVLALYRASSAGVPIKLLVRGFCTLRPKVKGLSENIQVFSLVGRFLEHHRIYHFRNGAKKMEDGLFYFGSADWMFRNLHERVEAVTPVTDSKLRSRLAKILGLTLKDNRHLWEQNSKGVYIQKKPKSKSHLFNVQNFFAD